MKRLAWGLVVALALLHHDFWLWDDRRLLFGWLPIGLGYHVALALVAGAAWGLVARCAWPTHIEDWSEAGQRSAG